jgi:hypothetical protein
MAGPCCHNCVYSVCDPDVWLHAMWAGAPVVPRCANHPQWPGQLHDVPGVPCRHYRPKPALPQGDGVRMIPLGDGFYAYVDAADYPELTRHVWYLSNGYAVRNENSKRIYMHRQLVEAPVGMVVDHIDGNRANNCRFNLRVCTRSENLRNQRKRLGSRSRFKGVLYDKQYHKWFAVCERHFRGYFDDEIQAARAYDRMAAQYLDEFARLNFPQEWPPDRRAEARAQREAAEALRAENRRRRTGAKKEGKKKAKSRTKKPRIEMTGRRGRRQRAKAGRSEGKKKKATCKGRGGTSDSPRRKTRRKRGSSR